VEVEDRVPSREGTSRAALLKHKTFFDLFPTMRPGKWFTTIYLFEIIQSSPSLRICKRNNKIEIHLFMTT
jgi:hypothetical protein